MIRDKFPKEYSQRANAAAKQGLAAAKTEPKIHQLDPTAITHFGLGCDGCGIWPIQGDAWEDANCPENVGFHLCDACYQLGFHRRVITGRFNQTHMPKHIMVKVTP